MFETVSLGILHFKLINVFVYILTDRDYVECETIVMVDGASSCNSRSFSPDWSEWEDEDMTNILLVTESNSTQSEPQTVSVPNETNPSDTDDHNMDELLTTEVEVGDNINMHDVESRPHCSTTPDDATAAESSECRECKGWGW